MCGSESLRAKIISGLESEHESWKLLDNTHDLTAEELSKIQSISNIPINTNNENECKFNEFGQDRVVLQDVDLDHNEDTRDKVCDLNQNTSDYCYKG